MDIDKLQKLGCLCLDEQVKDKMKESIESVMEMMQSISQIPSPEGVKDELSLTHLAEDKTSNENVIMKNDETNGLHMQDGLFLAPKTIRK